MEIQEKITRSMAIGEILKSFPDKSSILAEEMTKMGLHCVGCCASNWETLEEGMLGHGISDEAIDAFVERLNDLLRD